MMNTTFNTTVANIKEKFAPGKNSLGGAAMLDSIKNWDFTVSPGADRDELVSALARELNRKQYQALGPFPTWQTPISAYPDALQTAHELYDAFEGGGKPAAGSPEAKAAEDAAKAKVYKGSTAQKTGEQGLAHITSDEAVKLGINELV